MRPILVTIPLQFNHQTLRSYIDDIRQCIPEGNSPIPCTASVTQMGDSKVTCTFETEDQGKWHLTIELSPV